ncbi:MAG: hypothetical protein IJT91_05355 [Clostridia bacterium]|nr:hypothetical protein [Clostridia bacterium]
MKFNDYQILQGERSQTKETELISERAGRVSAETQRDEYRDRFDRIRSTLEGIPAVPTLSGLKEFVRTLREIIF